MRPPSCVALLDCNNFFVSCERARNRELEKVPVAVLSSNDGCIIARSEEVKALGIPMGMPYFKAQPIIKEHNIRIFSLNYTLYTETSARIMDLILYYAPNAEVYSIDEAFLDLSGMQYIDLNKFLTDLKNRIWEEMRIPVCIGVGPGKALAKLANRIAKKKKTTGIEVLMDSKSQEEALRATEVGDIWGVGRRNQMKLNKLGIKTGWDLRQASPSLMRRIGSIIEVRLVRELKGESCLMVDNYREPKKHILSSRSFGKKITTLHHAQEALTFLTSIAIRKLHKEKLATSYIRIYLSTARYNEPNIATVSEYIQLTAATDYPPDILYHVLQLVEKAFNTDYRFAKGGVIFAGLVAQGQVQGSLFEQAVDTKEEKVKALVNRLNRNQGGKKVIDWAGFQINDTSWMPKSEYRTEHEVEVDDELYDTARPWW
ncbi:MAG: Y-family DNA polymerase [Chitinophagales bacterium]|nr:Y-family DNA polymerase [Chitinophagales bacterium]